MHRIEQTLANSDGTSRSKESEGLLARDLTFNDDKQEVMESREELTRLELAVRTIGTILVELENITKETYRVEVIRE